MIDKEKLTSLIRNHLTGIVINELLIDDAQVVTIRPLTSNRFDIDVLPAESNTHRIFQVHISELKR